MENLRFRIPGIMGNHCQGAWRHFLRDKAFTALTVFGLALGLAACLFITLFVMDEFAYDRYNTKADRIFRVVSDLQINGGRMHDVSTPRPMAPALIHDFPAVETAVRI